MSVISPSVALWRSPGADNSPPTRRAPGPLPSIVAALRRGRAHRGDAGARCARVPGAACWVADDGSTDATAAARARGGRARSCGTGACVGKGEAMTRRARRARRRAGAASASSFLLCDGDLGDSRGAARPRWSTRSRAGGAELAVAPSRGASAAASGSRVGFARWAIRRRCGLRRSAPISGQRALRRAGAGRACCRSPRLRDGGRDDDRRGPGGLRASSSSSSTSRTARRAAPLPGFAHRGAAAASTSRARTRDA